MSKKITSVIFDMGGVLLQTINPKPRESLAARFGVTRSELEAFVFMSETSLQSELGDLSNKLHWETVLRHFNQPVEDYLKTYDEFFSGDGIDQELLTFAVSLKPDYRLGLLSNAWVNVRKLLNQHFDFLDLFDVSIFSCEVGTRKPEPTIYKLMLKKLGESAENAIFIDDMQINVEGAKNEGLHAIHYKNTPSIITEVREMLENRGDTPGKLSHS